jgi:hypothetical protein
VEHLKLIRQALWFVLEPLMMKNEHYSFGFYQELIQKMKNRRDAVSRRTRPSTARCTPSATSPWASSSPGKHEKKHLS